MIFSLLKSLLAPKSSNLFLIAILNLNYNIYKNQYLQSVINARKFNKKIAK